LLVANREGAGEGGDQRRHLRSAGPDADQARQLIAAANPDKVKTLQARVVQLTTEMQPPLFAMEALRATLANPPVFGPHPVADH
jgi:hypothetical protein